jgi:hypothetical protein
LTLKVEDFELKLVLSLLSFHLLSFALVDDIKQPLHLGLGLSQLLLSLPGMIPDDIGLAQQALYILFLGPKLAAKLLNKAGLLEVSVSLGLNGAGDVLIFPLDFDSAADSRLDLETLRF